MSAGCIDQPPIFRQNRSSGTAAPATGAASERRAALVLAVLSQLGTAEYGYSLKQELNDRGLDINEGTLYPLLRRLESQGLLESDWQVVDDTRPRRYYQISPLGTILFSNLTQEWDTLVDVMRRLLASPAGGK